MNATANPDMIAASTQAPDHTATTSDDQPLQGQTRIEIYTDGSCIGNPGYGGYGVVILRKDAEGTTLKRRLQSGHAAEMTTNIRMEMVGACVGLESIGEPTEEPITVFCDANLIPNTMNGWLAKWKAKGWRKSNGKAVENMDLWERLEQAAAGRNVTFAWVRGHNGSEHNEKADTLAYAAARRGEAKATGAR